MCPTTAAVAKAAQKYDDNRELLPTNVIPSHYDITLVPDLKSFRFGGQVSISLDVMESTKSITANAKELTISKASVTVFRVVDQGLGGVSHWPKDPETHWSYQDAISITFDEEKETVSFAFEHEIPATAKILLHANFEGIHNNQNFGFYRSGYLGADGVEQKYMVASQLAPASTRQVFPSWDEPALKATFDLTLHISKELMAVSNMAVIEEKLIQKEGATLKSVKFGTSPKMSTYLLVFCIGEFEYLELTAYPKLPLNSKPVVCRFYTLPGKKEKGRLALETTVKVLELYSEFFDIAYPIEKLDSISIPDHAYGGMESWGLITYMEQQVLHLPEGSGLMRSRVAYIVAHEISHQWFGNLVTMEWWNDLWLNESFATVVGAIFTDKMYPEMKYLNNFQSVTVEKGFEADSLRASHPIQVSIRNPTEANEVFDLITYNKGAGVLRMLESYLGSKAFRNGVNNYLKKFAYSNTVTIDLWDCLSLSSGIDVAALMNCWTSQTGFPVLSVIKEEFNEEKKTMTLLVKQNRFVSSGKFIPSDFTSKWIIPLTVQTSLGLSRFLITESEQEITFSFSSPKAVSSYWKLNFNGTGFFKVKYTPDQIHRLSWALEENIHCLSSLDRLTLITDTLSVCKAGLLSSTSFIELVSALKKEEDAGVLEQLEKSLVEFRINFSSDKEVQQGIKKVILSIFKPKLEVLGFDFQQGEDFLLTSKRATVISSCALSGDDFTVKELTRRFHARCNGDKKAMSSNIADPTFMSVLSVADESLQSNFEMLLTIFQTSEDVNERSQALRALSSVNSTSLLDRLFNEVWMKNGEIHPLIKNSDLKYGFWGMKNSPICNIAVQKKWDWYTKNFDTLYSRVGPLRMSLQLVVQDASGIEGEDMIRKTLAWKNKGDSRLSAGTRDLSNAIETVECNVNWFQRDFASLKELFKTMAL